MKHILKAAERLFTGAIAATTIIAITTILSCGEDTENVVTECPEGAASTFGEIKEIIAAAPQAPNVGAPYSVLPNRGAAHSLPDTGTRSKR